MSNIPKRDSSAAMPRSTDIAAMKSRNSDISQPSRPKYAKVKTGCRTCKIRKVKCDEAWPACKRCVSTGRCCDGYSVWGGGSLYARQQQAQTVAVVEGQGVPRSFPSNLTSDLQSHHLAWFKCRTTLKVTGLYRSIFWNSLLLLAIDTDAAVTHAVTALGTFHKANIDASPAQLKTLDQFSLQQYGAAMAALEPYFACRNARDVRIVLITCIVFTCLELLRGSFKTARAHLDNGLKVLAHILEPTLSKPLSSFGSAKHRAIQVVGDEALIAAFSRLQFQTELWEQRKLLPDLNAINSAAFQNHEVFDSILVASHCIAAIQSRALGLKDRFIHRSAARECSLQRSTATADLREQETLQTEVKAWLRVYNHSRSALSIEDTEEIAGRLLCAHQAMATVMVGTALSPGDTALFDLYTEHFLCIIKHAIEIRLVQTFERYPIKPHSGQTFVMGRSIIDIGWIPILYYTAVNCRVRRIRVHAIRLLESAPHREGIWDSFICSKIARRLMEIEQDNFYQACTLEDDFDLFEYPDACYPQLPQVPIARRVNNVEVTLPDGPQEHVVVRCRQGSRAAWSTCEHRFDPVSQSWTASVSESTTHEMIAQ